MMLHICDKCEETIENGKVYMVGRMFGRDCHAELCADCFVPYMLLMEQESILSDKLAKRLKKD